MAETKTGSAMRSEGWRILDKREGIERRRRKIPRDRHKDRRHGLSSV